MSVVHRGVAICHYNRSSHLAQIIRSVKATVPDGTKIVVCDDGSTDQKGHISNTCLEQEVLMLRGPNLGVAANKNRGLWALQKCHYIALLEDDLYPTEKGWFEIYEKACIQSEIQHFCRVQNKEIPESVPEFAQYMQKSGFTPIYGPSPRGDFTFITATVVNRVGGFNPLFRGAGFAHGEFSNRVAKAGLIGHPLKWVDIKEARDKFQQIGDTEGGRWNEPKTVITNQIKKNRDIYKKLDDSGYIYCPLSLE